jgi:hypothetical protein
MPGDAGRTGFEDSIKMKGFVNLNETEENSAEYN